MSTRIISLASARPAGCETPTGPVGTWFGRVTGWLADIDRRYRERRYLEEMDDALLRDIGLTRDDLRRAIRDPGASERN